MMEETRPVPAPDELARREAELEEKERRLEEKEKQLSALDAKVAGAKHSIYARLNVSLKTMDRVIALLVALLAVALVAAFALR